MSLIDLSGSSGIFKSSATIHAEVVPTKITEDYFAALTVLETRGALQTSGGIPPHTKLGHRKLIADLIFILKKAAKGATPRKNNKIEGLIDQIEKLGIAIARI